MHERPLSSTLRQLMQCGKRSNESLTKVESWSLSTRLCSRDQAQWLLIGVASTKTSRFASLVVKETTWPPLQASRMTKALSLSRYSTMRSIATTSLSFYKNLNRGKAIEESPYFWTTCRSITLCRSKKSASSWKFRWSTIAPTHQTFSQ